MEFGTSLDFLYVVLGISILWFTVFLCWILYQAGRVLKNANDIIENLSHKLEMIVEAVEFMKKKVDTLSGHMGIVSTLVSNMVEKMIVGKLNKKMSEEKVATKEKRRR